MPLTPQEQQALDDRQKVLNYLKAPNGPFQEWCVKELNHTCAVEGSTETGTTVPIVKINPSLPVDESLPAPAG